ncbi:hypothetical protein WJX74_000700 [Apatococcus lobatus]|uniref:Uncharacterized protein n=1 Tax=Apatococcus lobatus TaxID=904363 RepID=A0AAW1S1J6_9CHLO
MGSFEASTLPSLEESQTTDRQQEARKGACEHLGAWRQGQLVIGGQDGWGSLEQALLVHIASMLDTWDLRAMRLTCRGWHAAAAWAVDSLQPACADIPALAAAFPGLRSLNLALACKLEGLDPQRLEQQHSCSEQEALFKNVSKVRRLEHLILPSYEGRQATLNNAVSSVSLRLPDLKSLSMETVVYEPWQTLPSALTRLQADVVPQAAQDSLQVVRRSCHQLQHLMFAGLSAVDVDDGSARLRLGDLAADLPCLACLQVPRWQVDALDLRGLSNLRHLTRLELSDCALHAIEYEAIARISTLQSLSLSWLLQLSLEGLMELTRLERLTHLDLHHSDSVDPTRGSVAAAAARSLASMTQLSSLCLRSVEALTPLISLLTPLTGLTLLDLSECCRIDGGCVGNLTSLQRLRHLNLRWIRPLEFDCQWFRQWTDMRTLQLDYVEGIRNSSALMNQPDLRLTSLSIRSCKGATDQFLEHLACVKSLRYLDVSLCEAVSVVGLAHISRLPRLDTLRLQHCHRILQPPASTLDDQPAATPGSTAVCPTAAGCLNRMTSLRCLDLAWQQGVTPAFLQEALRGFARLETLVVGAGQPFFLRSLLENLPVLPRLSHLAVLYGDLTCPDAEAEMPISHIRDHLPSLRYMMLPLHTMVKGTAGSSIVETVCRAGCTLGFLPQFMSIESLSGSAGFNPRISIEQAECLYSRLAL